MSTRTASWVNRTNPGAAPPPPSRTYTAPPPTIYPESSVSNPNASRYTGRSSRASSHAPSHHSGSQHSRSRSLSVGPPPSHHSSSHHSSHHSGTQASRTVTPAMVDGRPMQTYYAPSQQPIIARTSSANGKTSSYMIIPAAGQKVEILHPTPARSQTMPASASSYSSSYSYASPTKEKPLIKRLFDKVEWSGSGSGSGAGKSSASKSGSKISLRSRRNSTGGAGTRVSTSSGTRITSGSGRVYEVTYV